MKYKFMKNLGQYMYCILGFGVILSLALPTGKFLLWCQVSTPWNPKSVDEGLGKTSSDGIKSSRVGSLLSSTSVPSRHSMKISASVVVVPRLPGGRMGRGVSSSSFSLNLSTPYSYGTTYEAMKESKEVLSKSKSYYSGTSFMVCTILLVA